MWRQIYKHGLKSGTNKTVCETDDYRRQIEKAFTVQPDKTGQPYSKNEYAGKNEAGYVTFVQKFASRKTGHNQSQCKKNKKEPRYGFEF